MRVLLIQSKHTVGEPVLPLGLLYVATSLTNHDHEVRILDMNITNDHFADVRKLIRSFEPEIIGVGIRNIDNQQYFAYRSFFEPFLTLVSALKNTSPTSIILAGGSGFSIFAHEFMKRVPALDYGVLNEGEETMPELLDNLDAPGSVRGIFYRRDDTIRFTGARAHIDFANMSAPRRDMVDLTPYLDYPFSIGVQTKRGCPLTCAYCIYPYLQGAEIRMRPIESVVDELDELASKYGVRNFFFVDSVFNVPPLYARELLEKMLARGLNLRWRSYDNLKLIDAGYMKLAIEAGCDCIELSPDGISKSTLTALNKNFVKQDIERVCSIAKQIDDVKVNFCFFINGPGESVGNLINLFFFILRFRFISNKKVGSLIIHPIRIYPHTPLHTLAVEKGIIKEDDDLLIGPGFYNPAPLRYLLAILSPILRWLSSLLH